MNLLVHGSRTFNDYAVFMRSMLVILSSMEGQELTIYSTGGNNLNNHVREFVNITQRSLSARGIKLEFRLIPLAEAKNVEKFDKLFYFCNTGERTPEIVDTYDAANKEVLVFRY